MELAIVLLLVFIVWTNEELFGQPIIKEIKPKTADEKFLAALKDYMKEGFPVRVIEKKDDKKGS